MLAVVAVENPAGLARILAKLFRQRRALPSTRCECAASGKSTSILELSWRMLRRRWHTRLTVRPWRNHIPRRSRIMFRMEHVLASLASSPLRLPSPSRLDMGYRPTAWRAGGNTKTAPFFQITPEVSTFEQIGNEKYTSWGSRTSSSGHQIWLVASMFSLVLLSVILLIHC